MALTHHQVKRLRRMGEGQPNRLKAARELAGLTQVQLAEALGLTQSALSDIERRRYSGGTTVETARKFAEFFGCLIEDIFPATSEVA
jgi:DNA-binding XRE family transcriptional regulator